MEFPSEDPRATEIFADYLSRIDAGEEVDFEAFCRRHEEYGEGLRALRQHWTALRHVLEHRSEAESKAASHGSSRRTPDGPTAIERPSGAMSSILSSLEEHSTRRNRYQLKGEIARGGMGAILRVWDEELGRHLAMKVIVGRGDGKTPDTEHADPRMLERFLEEARVTGQLDHPGIVPVHELGLDADRRVFFTMKLVKGRELNKIFAWVRKAKEGWTQTRALGVLLKVCEAMAYAHAKGVIHRDLKPANIMVGRFGEVYVMDWGLARVLDREDKRDIRIRGETLATTGVQSARGGSSMDPNSPLITMDGDVVGTPAYMSPEQAAGLIEDMGPQADVYSLGAMLYELLTGHPPYLRPGKRLTNYAIWSLVQDGPPHSVLTESPEAAIEIAAICEKAMGRDAADRYPDMSALAADLRAYLEGRVVAAYETGAVAELRKWITRNRGLASAIAATVLALAIGLVASLYFGREAHRQRRNVFHLAAFQRLEELETRAAELWPPLSGHVEDYEHWLADTAELTAELERPGDGHYAQLRALRADARRAETADAQRLLEAHPRSAELEALEAEIEALDHAARVRAAADPAEALAEPELDPALAAATATELNTLAWALVDPERSIHGGEAEGLALARQAVARATKPKHRAQYGDTLAWAFFANGLDGEAEEAMKAAIAAAPPGEEGLYEANLLSLLEAVTGAQGEAGAERREQLGRRLERLRDEVASDSVWLFDDEETAWWHGQLVALVHAIEDVADPDSGLAAGISAQNGWGVERRLACARRVADLSSGDFARRRWTEATAAIAEHPRYGGLTLAPQEGLFPLGPDPVSGLWEFAQVISGDVPVRGSGGTLEIDAESGVVFILLPGGTFRMGAQARDTRAPNYDRYAHADEGPSHAVQLDPFFISKFELTQAQWLRLTGENPSSQAIGRTWGRHSIDGTHPIENVSWIECARVLAWYDMALPTEAQWEYAARAGTPTPWYTGTARETVLGHANLADRSAAVVGMPWPATADWPELDDDYASHAPVWSFAPNPFGLHHVIGNVREWCRDTFESYHVPPSAGTGERAVQRPEYRASRGGSQMDKAADARVTFRQRFSPGFRFGYLGVRPARPIRP